MYIKLWQDIDDLVEQKEKIEILDLELYLDLGRVGMLLINAGCYMDKSGIYYTKDN